MAILKFRIYLEEDDAVYRDIIIRHTQNFQELHYAILKSYEFDSKHKATFFRRYDKPYVVEPLIMQDITIGSEIRDTNQKFVFEYDFEKHWIFLVELINVSKEESSKAVYPSVSRTEGIGPQQYGTKSLLGEKFADIEEKYDLSEAAEGFGTEGEDVDTEKDESGAAEDPQEEEF
jgi:hypothetical protein